MKDIKEITKNFKSFTDFIYDSVTNAKDFVELPDDQAEKLDKAWNDISKNIGIDMVMAKVSKIASLNILDKDVTFKVFDKLPNVWKAYQSAAEASIKQIKE